MIPVKKILLPTDFSDNAQNALIFALELAKKTGAQLELLHCIEEPYNFAPMVDQIMQQIVQKSEQLFDNIKDDIHKNHRYTGIDVQTSIQTGKSTLTILEEAKKEHSDIIVMGTRGRSGVERFLYGSTTAHVVQHSNIPVLIIPQNAVFKGFEHILFATDYHDGDLQALNYVAQLAELFDSGINVFHSSIENDLRSEIMFLGFRQLVKNTIAYSNIRFEQDKTISFFEAVANRIDKNTISMMVMVRYSRPYSIFKKKESKEMSYYIQVPLLMLPGKEAMQSTELKKVAKEKTIKG